jgi:hypothetical protein
MEVRIQHFASRDRLLYIDEVDVGTLGDALDAPDRSYVSETLGSRLRQSLGT